MRQGLGKRSLKVSTEDTEIQRTCRKRVRESKRVWAHVIVDNILLCNGKKCPMYHDTSTSKSPIKVCANYVYFCSKWYFDNTLMQAKCTFIVILQSHVQGLYTYIYP